jgi:hypothetical protein
VPMWRCSVHKMLRVVGMQWRGAMEVTKDAVVDAKIVVKDMSAVCKPCMTASK